MKNSRTEQFDRLIENSLRAHLTRQSSLSVDVWPRVKTRALARDERVAGRLWTSRRRGRVFVIGLSCWAIAATGLTVAGAASHQTSQPQASEGIAEAADGSLMGLSPAPLFGARTPNYLPRQLQEHLYSYSSDASAGRGVLTSTITFPDAVLNGQTNLNPSGNASLFQAYANRTGTAFVDILEQPRVSGNSLPVGQPVNVDDVHGILHQHGSISEVDFVLVDSMTLRQHGAETTVDSAPVATEFRVRSDLGSSETLRIANSIRQRVDPVDRNLWPSIVPHHG